jgi:hypothetical protein
MSDWQYRKYYGYKVGPDNSGWTDWSDLEEGPLFYTPRTLFELDPNAVGHLEFRKTPTDDPHCLFCDLAVEDLGLCFQHLNEELDLFNAEDDPWPDFPAWERDEWDNYTGYGA